MISLFFVLVAAGLTFAALRLMRRIPEEDAHSAQLWKTTKRYDKTHLDIRLLSVVCALLAVGCLVYALLLAVGAVSP